MQGWNLPLQELEEVNRIWEREKERKGMVSFSGCIPSQISHFISYLGKSFAKKIIVCPKESRALEVYQELVSLEEEVWYYPCKDFLFHHADIRSQELTKQRIEVLQNIGEKEKISIVTTIEGCMDGLPPIEFFQTSFFSITLGQVLELEKLIQMLESLGYLRTSQVEMIGQYTVRGGIVDIYPLTKDYPVRIEFWGDEVDSIRTFDTENQRSLENLEEIQIGVATERGSDSKKVSFLEEFNPKESGLFLVEPIRVMERGKESEAEFLDAMERRKVSKCQMESEIEFFSMEEVCYQMNRFSMAGFSGLEQEVTGLLEKARLHLEIRGVPSYQGNFDVLIRDLRSWKRKGYRTILFSPSRSRGRRLAEDFRDYQLHSYFSEDRNREVKEGELMVTCGYLSSGYEYPELGFSVITEADLFGKKKRNLGKERKHQVDFSFLDLKAGDYVVHETHGLGIFQGMETITLDKIAKDFLKISYAKGGNLYIPVTHLDAIQKYGSKDAKPPKLSTLYTKEWSNTKKRVRVAVQGVAKELVELYAQRQEEEGYIYGADTLWQQEFEELFPHEETEDQKLAISEVKKDMESEKIMDRLICGDVGYGKTEIAIRAAFKAVQEDRQVVYLVPTTILAQQHYQTFLQRMKNYPVRIDLLCRFRTPTEQKKTIQDVEKGLVDIVIGTHRVLSQDLKCKNLGLLIVDEEQRFGVLHKEKLKQWRKNIDVLTLTATPIPRTLHMSLIGIRDMSILEEAPRERLPIQTYVLEYNEELVREGIERECGRGGQVYYVYNRIQDIHKMAERLQELLPERRIAYAHGKMKEHKLEQVMESFIQKEIDVLVSTTIIETGLDIPNANTMMIHDADCFGLSQLYQLRGRVGRSHRMAYAFLFYSKEKQLKEVAEKRLSAIREFTQLGSGFKIAMRDLEIRGAGNLLGESQHGYMEAVGYDLYCKMLNEEVKRQKGILEEESYQTTVDISLDAYIPDTYIGNGEQKLEMYRRIAAISNQKEKEDMVDELLDRYGDLPRQVESLLKVVELKVMAHQNFMESIEEKEGNIRFGMYEKAKIQTEKLDFFLESWKNQVRILTQKNQTYFVLKGRGMEVIEKFLTSFKQVLIEKGGREDEHQ